MNLKNQNHSHQDQQDESPGTMAIAVAAMPFTGLGRAGASPAHPPRLHPYAPIPDSSNFDARMRLPFHTSSLSHPHGATCGQKAARLHQVQNPSQGPLFLQAAPAAAPSCPLKCLSAPDCTVIYHTCMPAMLHNRANHSGSAAHLAGPGFHLCAVLEHHRTLCPNLGHHSVVD